MRKMLKLPAPAVAVALLLWSQLQAKHLSRTAAYHHRHDLGQGCLHYCRQCCYPSVLQAEEEQCWRLKQRECYPQAARRQWNELLALLPLLVPGSVRHLFL
jgi:hypothetical protein